MNKPKCVLLRSITLTSSHWHQASISTRAQEAIYFSQILTTVSQCS